MSDSKLQHIQDDSFFLATVATQADYDIAANIRERIRDREEEVDVVYAPIQDRQKLQASQLKADRHKTATERASWLVVHDSQGERHELNTIDQHLKTVMTEWATEQHRKETTKRQLQDTILLEAQKDVKQKMIVEAVGDPDLIKEIQETSFLPPPPTATARQSNTTSNVQVKVLDVSRINSKFIQANLPKIKALANSQGIEHALDAIGREGVTIEQTLAPRLRPRRRPQ